MTTKERKIKDYLARIICGNGCYCGLGMDNGKCDDCPNWDENINQATVIISTFPSIMNDELD